MSQMRLARHNQPVHQRTVGHPVGTQRAWPQDERWPSHNQQHSCQQQAPPPQWGYYYHQDAQDPSLRQQHPESQPLPSRNQTSQRVAVGGPQPVAEAHGRQEDGKRTLQFTPDMIRDQELLVSTMRQQGVPHDVMRRQFDALLHEQRKHLTYVAQFRQQQTTDVPEVKRTCRLLRSRTENDEKPEWMLHITPPRISYSDLERIKLQQQRLVPNEQRPTKVPDQPPEQVGRNNPPAQQQQLQQRDYHPQRPREEAIVQAVVPRPMYLQANPPHPWQQQTADWSRGSDHQALHAFAGCYPYGPRQNVLNDFYPQPSLHGYDQPQRGFYRYPCDDTPRESYQAHPERRKTWSEEHNASPNDKQRASVDTVDRSGRPTEPSSLLKMRLYKEVIRPQKRNNGLQDPEKALETLKDQTSREGLEYLANLARKRPQVRLNGAQEADEIPEDLRQRPLENPLPVPRVVSSNGLENKRNPDNPAPCVQRPRRADEPAMMEYPRQRQSLKTHYIDGAPAETTAGSSQRPDHAAVVSQDALNVGSSMGMMIPRDRVPRAGPVDDHVMTLPYGGAPCYQQTRQYRYNRPSLVASHNGGQGDGIASARRSDAPEDATGIDQAGGDALGENPSAEETATKRGPNRQQRSMLETSRPYGRAEIREARSVDCAAAHLLAGRTDCVPNHSFAVSPDQLLASRHVQPPMII